MNEDTTGNVTPGNSYADARRGTLDAVARETVRRTVKDLEWIAALSGPDMDNGCCPACGRRSDTIVVDRMQWEVCLACRKRAAGPYYGPVGVLGGPHDRDNFAGRVLLEMCEPVIFNGPPPALTVVAAIDAGEGAAP
jgi:hypothetical protein